jgi:hypothetical protein
MTLRDDTGYGTSGLSARAFYQPYGFARAAAAMLRAVGYFLECVVSRRLPLVVLFFVLALWLAVSYGLRYGLMEDVQWVGICADEASKWQCQLRSNLGLWIHFGVFGWGALITALVAFFIPRQVGRALAVVGLLLGILALVLYTASLAVFAVVIAGLRLVRDQRA